MRLPGGSLQALICGTLALALLSGSAGCSGPKRLETSLGGRRAESLKAEARKADGRWQVELLLPAGSWRVETEEAQTVTLIPGEPRATLRWAVDPERWSQQDKPFRFTLVGEGGLRLPMSVRYPDVLPTGLSTVINVLCGRWTYPA